EFRRVLFRSEELEAFGEVVCAERVQRPEAPGQLPSHYTPRTPLVLAEDPLSFAVPLNRKCGLLAWRSLEGAKQFAEIRQLSSRQDRKSTRLNLFRCLRELD